MGFRPLSEDSLHLRARVFNHPYRDNNHYDSFPLNGITINSHSQINTAVIAKVHLHLSRTTLPYDIQRVTLTLDVHLACHSFP